MYKSIILFILAVFYANASMSQNKIENLNLIDSIDKIPIFSKININKKGSSDFDSKHGKILILNFELKPKYENEMKEFYKNFFKNIGWILLVKNKNLIHFENKGKHTHKKLIIRRHSDNSWNLNFIVENF